MTGRRGFALLTTLWLIVAAATVVTVALSNARIEQQAAMNRLILSRAMWSRDACVAVLQDQFDFANPLRGVDSIDLGRGSWCRATVEDPSARLDINHADARELSRVLGSDSLADAIIDWRDADDTARPLGAEADYYLGQRRPLPPNQPFGDLQELRLVRGLERFNTDSLAGELTVNGRGVVNASRADARVIASLPGLLPSDARALESARSMGWTPRSLDEVLERLGGTRRQELQPWVPELQTRMSFRTEEVVIHVEGGVRGSVVRSRATLRAVPLPERLAIVRRVTW